MQIKPETGLGPLQVNLAGPLIDTALALAAELDLALRGPGAVPETATPFGEIRFGTSSASSMTISSGEIGLVGMGGNDTLNGGSAPDFLAGDYFDVALIDTFPVPFDASVIGNDVLYGNGGGDLLDGGVGNDKLYGGDGDDFFSLVEQNPGNDTFSGGAGYDRLRIEDGWGAGYTTVNLNRLILDAAASIEELDLYDRIQIAGTEGADVFDLSGISYFFSESADQKLVLNLGGGNDRYTGGSFVEEVHGGAGNDTLSGRNGADTLDGGGGADSLTGGGGGDTFIVDAAGDVVVEVADAGTDTVRTSLTTYTLANNVEKVVATTNSAFNLTGNGLANTITGNTGNDTLSGGDGNDTLYGKAGLDLLTGGAGKDVFIFDTPLNSSKKDTITDFSPVDDTIKLENSGSGLFNALPTGTLSAAAFKVIGSTGASVDSSDRIIYNDQTGMLSYDPDGAGGVAAVGFAVLTTHPALTNADFVVF